MDPDKCFWINGHEELFRALQPYRCAGIVQNSMWVSARQCRDWERVARDCGVPDRLLENVKAYLEFQLGQYMAVGPSKDADDIPEEDRIPHFYHPGRPLHSPI